MMPRSLIVDRESIAQRMVYLFLVFHLLSAAILGSPLLAFFSSHVLVLYKVKLCLPPMTSFLPSLDHAYQ
ncbi:hypothetical protein ARMSODRAFT_397176 [Armillaria solidipes]|uniref:Uncharacterized protein n=1 Tax=Armillaria solidipes TaxID=1076256 RepID=A0A2H3C8M1_9AGAR|nr:hypothetical protein ARMSODRAFT_397176 [Armillaria solidipes]